MKSNAKGYTVRPNEGVLVQDSTIFVVVEASSSKGYSQGDQFLVQSSAIGQDEHEMLDYAQWRIREKRGLVQRHVLGVRDAGVDLKNPFILSHFDERERHAFPS